MAIASTLILVGCGPALAQLQIGVYGGWNGTPPADVMVAQPGGPNATFFRVPWNGNAFSPPLHYGIRGTYWFAPAPGWGVMIDFVHAKAYAELGAVVAISTGGTAQLSDYFSRLEFSDGLNLLTVNAVYRWSGDRLIPYAGAGIGLTIPHVEVNGPGLQQTFEYQVTGGAAQLFAGAEMPVGDRFAFFGEFRFSRAWVNAELNGGGSLVTKMLVLHGSAGVRLRFGR